MKSTCLTLLMVILVAVAGPAYGQLRFPDATEQTTAYMGATSGGSGNAAGGVDGTVGGGYNNSVTDDYGTVGGGYSNQAGDAAGSTDDAPYATVGGGSSNSASGYSATVGGGGSNMVTNDYGTIGGGYDNTASESAGTVSGGRSNTASGYYTTVGGGYGNTASGYSATVGGGYFNTASGDYSFAAGRRANASHDHSFVWGDSTDATTDDSPGAHTFNIYASNGVYLNGVLHAPSDRSKKDNFERVDSRAVLAKVAALPMSTWTYKTEDGGYRHMGPMGQDFYAAFALGTDDKHITTVDADGVALAAIQGLYETVNEVVQEKDAQIKALQKKLETLEARLDSLMQK